MGWWKTIVLIRVKRTSAACIIVITNAYLSWSRKTVTGYLMPSSKGSTTLWYLELLPTVDVYTLLQFANACYVTICSTIYLYQQQQTQRKKNPERHTEASHASKCYERDQHCKWITQQDTLKPADNLCPGRKTELMLKTKWQIGLNVLHLHCISLRLARSAMTTYCMHRSKGLLTM